MAFNKVTLLLLVSHLLTRRTTGNLTVLAGQNRYVAICDAMTCNLQPVDDSGAYSGRCMVQLNLALNLRSHLTQTKKAMC